MESLDSQQDLEASAAPTEDAATTNRLDEKPGEDVQDEIEVEGISCDDSGGS